MLVRVKTGESVSKLLGILSFLLLLILKGVFPKAALAFTGSSLDSCALQPECVAAVGSELAPVIATPTAEGVSATITATTAAGTSTTTQAAAGVTVVGDMRLSGIAAYYLWKQAQNGQAQERARERYCAAYSNDYVCTPFTGGQGDGVVYTVRATMEVTYYNTPTAYYNDHVVEQSATFNIWGSIQSIDAALIDAPYDKNLWNKVFKIKSRGLYNYGNTYYPIKPLNIYDYGLGEQNKAYPITVRFVRATVNRADGQPDTSGNPPPLPWKDWPQEKRSIAVAALSPADWLEFVKEIPVGGVLKPGDKINAPGGIINPGKLEDDPNTPEDERLLRKEPGFFTYPGLPNRDFDRDGKPDTSDPEPQNPNVPIASSEPPPPEESVPGVDVPFSAPDPAQPPNEAVTDKARNMNNIPDGTDCSEIAEDLLEAAGNVGEIIEVLPAQGQYLNLYEYGKEVDGFIYHQVYTDGKYVYDPRLSPDPVRRGEWEEMIRKLNPGATFHSIYNQ
jgi:hypothetical protein